MSSPNAKFISPRGLIKVKQRVSMPQLILIVILMVAIAIGAIPGYISGKWSWSDLPDVANISQLRSLKKAGLTIPKWQTTNHAEVRLGGHEWSIQRLEQEGQPPIDLFLMPQDYYRTQPEVEWTDIDGIERWEKDSPKILKFSTQTDSNSLIQARFFRGWKAQTFAVVQWYAWEGGGHFAPVQWFWRDQVAQLKRDRVAWIAVSLKIPIDPLKDLEEVEDFAKSLAKTIQATLEQEVFREQPPKK